MARQFVLPGRGGKSLPQVIVGRIPQLLDRVGAHVVVGEHEAVGRDQGPRPARTEPHARPLEMEKPVGRDGHAVITLELLDRRG